MELLNYCTSKLYLIFALSYFTSLRPAHQADFYSWRKPVIILVKSNNSAGTENSWRRTYFKRLMSLSNFRNALRKVYFLVNKKYILFTSFNRQKSFEPAELSLCCYGIDVRCLNTNKHSLYIHVTRRMSAKKKKKQF